VKRPFGALVLLLRTTEFASETTLGDIGKLLGEPAERVADALVAIRMLEGQPTYLDLNGNVR
jgi:hypothetical protein